MAQPRQPAQHQPPQHQDWQPGIESVMTPRPRAEDPTYRGSGKLQDKVALITGGDSGIGRAVALLYAREGADIAMVYLNEHSDAVWSKYPNALLYHRLRFYHDARFNLNFIAFWPILITM